MEIRKETLLLYWVYNKKLPNQKIIIRFLENIKQKYITVKL